jgi:[ribosomal protein S18]-alanine N-acetyltransferase
MLMVRPWLRRNKGWRGSISAPKGGGRAKLWKTRDEPAVPRKERPGGASDGGYNGRVSFTVRDFEPADFEALWRIDQGCFPPGIAYSRVELRFYMRRRAAFTLVAAGFAQGDTESDGFGEGKKHSSASLAVEVGADIAGFIVAEADGRDHGHIITIDVISGARRSGVGSSLLGAAEDRLRSAGCRSVELETAVDNVSALSFYKRHGYSVTRTFPRYYSNGVDALVLEKNLD